MKLSKRLIAQILFGVLGLGILYWTITTYGLQNYIDTLLRVSPVFLAFAFIPPILEELSSAYQLHKIYSTSNVNLSFEDMFWINAWGSFLGNLQKGVGILVAIDSIALRSKTSRIDVTGRYSIYYAVNMIVRAIATLVGFVYLIRIVPVEYQSIVSLFILVIGLGSVGVLATAFGPQSIKDLIQRMFGWIPVVGKVVSSVASIKLTDTPLLIIIELFMFAIGNWLFSAFHWVVVSWAIGYPIDFWFCLATGGLLSLPKLLPFFPTSIGIYDVVVMIGLGAINVPTYVGLSFAMVERFTDVGSSLIAIIKPEYLRFFNNGKNQST